MKYLVAFDIANSHRLGTDFTKVSHKKSIRGWKNDALNMQKFQPHIETVYALSDFLYDQECCELTGIEFTNYVQHMGIKVL